MVDVYMSWLVSETLYLLGHWASSRTSNMVRLFERQPVSCAQCLVSREPDILSVGLLRERSHQVVTILASSRTPTWLGFLNGNLCLVRSVWLVESLTHH